MLLSQQKGKGDCMLIRKMMKADLLVAMKAQQKEAVSTLRSLLGALDNAEAVPVTTPV